MGYEALRQKSFLLQRLGHVLLHLGDLIAEGGILLKSGGSIEGDYSEIYGGGVNLTYEYDVLDSPL